MEILAVFFPVNKYQNKSCIQLMLFAKNVVLDLSRKDQALRERRQMKKLGVRLHLVTDVTQFL